MARLTEKVTLPSNGVLYDPKRIPASLTIHNMTVEDEALLYGSNSDKAITQILKSVIEEDIDVDELITADKHFLLVRARILTYGPIYKVSGIRCRCGKDQTYEIDLAKLPVNMLDSSTEIEREITLPVSGLVFKIKLPTGYDILEMEREVKRKVSKYNINEGVANYIGGLAMNIVAINGNDVLFDEAYKFVSELTGRDSSYLKKEINSIEVGLDTLIIEECSSCGRDIEFRLPMSSDFFRSVDDLTDRS